MIPLYDKNPTYSKPVVTIALVVVNALAFFYELSLGEMGRRGLFFTLGMVPARVLLFPASPEIGAGEAFLPLLSSMFLHGGWLHIIGNMWFLWIFGDNIEDRMGHLRYLVFYLLMGVVAGLAHTVVNLHSTVPAIGASGAVSGVMGAYLLLFPRSRVVTLVTLGFFWFRTELPAYVMILYWFAIQLLSGTVSLAAAGEGGVAWWAHIGGFVAGVALVKVFQQRQRRRVTYYEPR
ncbi:MAG: rhomboid family intramembrane serine protease [Terriglobia bacterium]